MILFYRCCFSWIRKNGNWFMWCFASRKNINFAIPIKSVFNKDQNNYYILRKMFVSIKSKINGNKYYLQDVWDECLCKL